LRIVVVNKDLKRSGTVRIAVPRGRRAGTLTRLSAPRASSTSGVSFGGQTIPNPTFDGLLQGSPVASSVRPARGVYSFAMPRASAALLTIG
ncbi:MAG: glycosyl hydrolase family 79 C-terminal domain-containing protein, partial [Thermoleophilaceae bacterium]